MRFTGINVTKILTIILSLVAVLLAGDLYFSINSSMEKQVERLESKTTEELNKINKTDMKIIVQGNIIDTDYVYLVTEVKEREYEDYLGGIVCYFDICFLNEGILTIEVKERSLSYKPQKGKKKLAVFKEAEKYRDFVLDHWNKDALAIPRMD